VRWRIVAAIVGVTTIAVVLFAIPLAIAAAHSSRDEAVLELQRQATLSSAVVPAETWEDTAGLPVKLPSGEASISVSIYGLDGRRIAGVGPDRADAPVQAALNGNDSDGHSGDDLVVAVPVAIDGQPVGAVRAAEPLSQSWGRTRQSLLVMAGFGLAVIAAATGVAMFLASRLARPVTELRDAASRLGDGDFAARLLTSGIRELDEVADALTAAGRRIGRLVDRERSFSTDASHQLRTPLTSLRLTLETELACPRPEASLALEEAMADVDRLEITVDTLLQLARDLPDRRPLDVPGILETVERQWRRRLEPIGRRLTVAIEGRLPSTRASTPAVGHIIDVLVDNAAVHGSGTIDVTARPGPTGGVTIAVADDGEGIIGNPERIFDRRASDTGGTGIGLALARSLAEAEGGRLRLARRGPRPVFELLVPGAQTEHGGEGVGPDSATRA